MPSIPRPTSPLLPTYAFTLCILILCLFPLLASSSNQAVFTPIGGQPLPPKTVHLKHIYHHGSSDGPFPSLFRRLDFSAASLAALSPGEETTFGVGMQLGKTFKPSKEHTRAIRRVRTNGGMRSLMMDMGVNAYEQGLGLLPDTKDNETVLSLAKMTNNAYNDANKRDDWYDLGDKWGVNVSFGWESDGLRGHVFGDDNNTTLILSIKGTSVAIIGGGDTVNKDKLNDNLLFSCCCARVGSSWRTVCDCYKGDYQCDTNCVENSLESEELYYSIAMKIFFELADEYPDADIWLTGHSLGGALAALLGLTFGLPTVTFEIMGDALPARRLHLPSPPALDYAEIPMWHFGNTADPIFMGVCTGPMSSCWYGGFAMEARCHTGRTCVYDVVNDAGWKVDIRSHGIQSVIEKIITKWELPECFVENECIDCGMWNFGDDESKRGVGMLGSMERCGV